MRWSVAALVAALLAVGCSTSSGHQASGSGSAQPSARTTPSAASSPARSRSSAPATSTSPAPPGAGKHVIRRHVKGHVVTVLNNGSVRVCSLITGAEASRALGHTLAAPRPVPVGTYDECMAKPAHAPAGSAAEAAWAVPPTHQAALLFRQHTVNLPASDAVRGLGSKAFCGTTPAPAGAQLYVLSGGRLLEVFTPRCDQAVELARLALGRL
jgi:hypothetical protein